MHLNKATCVRITIADRDFFHYSVYYIRCVT